MPKFVPVVDTEKPRAEQGRDANFDKHRKFDNPHKVDRGWQQGNVGWGVLGEFGSSAKDNSAQVVKRAEGSNKMVKNERGLWVKVKDVRNDEAPISKPSRGRGGGISVLDELTSRTMGESIKEERKPELPHQFDDHDYRGKSKSARKSRSRSREKRSRDRDHSRDRYIRGKHRKRSPSRSRSDSRNQDRNKSRYSDLDRDRGRDRDGDRDRGRNRDGDRDRGRDRDGDRDRDRDRDGDRDRGRDRDGDRDRGRNRDGDRDRGRDRDGDRDRGRDRDGDRDRVRDRSGNVRSYRDYRSESRERYHSRRYSGDDSQERQSSSYKQKKIYQDSENNNRYNIQNSSNHATTTTNNTNNNNNDNLVEEDEIIPPEEMVLNSITAIQIVNRFHEVFARKTLFPSERLNNIGELFIPDAIIASLKNNQNIYLTGKERIQESFGKTIENECMISKRIYIEIPKDTALLPTTSTTINGMKQPTEEGEEENEIIQETSKLTPSATTTTSTTYCIDLHRPNTVPGIGDKTQHNILLYRCQNAHITHIYGMVDAEKLSASENLTLKDITNSKFWIYVKNIVQKDCLNVDIESILHFHNYDKMEVWGLF